LSPPDASRFSLDSGDPVQLLDDLVGPEVRPRNGRESFSRMAVHDRQVSDISADGALIMRM
jgi:hypothetical protein